jgi:hypothetical protein
MISEGEKYRAQTFNIGGFALMAPLGKIAMQPLETYNEYGLVGFVCYTIFCLLLFSLGLYFIQKGYEVLNE